VLRNALLAGAAFVAMEPVAYAAHRWVMHGPGWGLHRSHHRDVAQAGAATAATGSWRHRVEANDAFPVAFAGATILAMGAGTRYRRLASLVPVAAGVTAYGAAYSAVHDVYIHQRLGRRPVRRAEAGLGATLAQAHAQHHRSGGEPYGMLIPLGWRSGEPLGVRSGERAGIHTNESTAGGVRNA
jgi:beta-carotene 3-hydroxylase